jgi:uncharacterized iron-regulated membrane protein
MTDVTASRPERTTRSVAPTRKRIRARTIWLKIHLYIALWLGAFITILALSGVLLVFHPEIERAIHPDLPPLQAGAQISPDAAIEAAERQLNLTAGFIRMPRADYPIYSVELFDERNTDYRIASVDAATGEVLRDRVWGQTFVTFLFNVHTHLLIDDYGLTIVGWLGVVLLVSIATGIYLWWPRAVATFRQAFTFRWSRSALALNFEAHRISGIWMSLVLIVVTFAGTYIALPELFNPAIEIFGPVSEEPEEVLSSTAPEGARAISLARIQEVVQTSSPGARITSIVFPDHASDSYSVHYVDRQERDNYYGQSTLWLDQYTGAVLRSHAYSQMSRTDRFAAVQLSLHGGQYFGITGRLLVLLSGVVLCVLYGTGLYLWWKRRRRVTSPARTAAPAVRS